MPLQPHWYSHSDLCWWLLQADQKTCHFGFQRTPCRTNTNSVSIAINFIIRRNKHCLYLRELIQFLLQNSKCWKFNQEPKSCGCSHRWTRTSLFIFRFHCIHFALYICQVMLDIGANAVLFIVLLPVPGVNIATAWSINSAKMVQLMVVIRGAKAHHDGWSNFLVAREALWMFPANFSILMQCNKSCFLESNWNTSNQARDFPWGGFEGSITSWARK